MMQSEIKALLDRASGARSVLFVCLGNICRSPLAEGLMKHQAKLAGVEALVHIESRGTGDWHVGDLPDPRARQVAEKHGVVLRSRAKLLRVDDLHEFDLILGMDRQNLLNIRALGAVRGTAGLLRAFDPLARRQPSTGNLDVPDPYHDGPDAFEAVCTMVSAATGALLERIIADTSSRA